MPLSLPAEVEGAAEARQHQQHQQHQHQQQPLALRPMAVSWAAEAAVLVADGGGLMLCGAHGVVVTMVASACPWSGDEAAHLPTEQKAYTHTHTHTHAR